MSPLWATWGARFVKTLIIVDDDIDPFDWTQVEWALATQVQPHRDVEILKDLVGCVLDPPFRCTSGRRVTLTPQR
ncbi:MAG: UbiD family decarboxylase [Candidatus Binatia bacterium]|nr:UbiD family decarboxylase [Candidatus Binatia bacterium]